MCVWRCMTGVAAAAWYLHMMSHSLIDRLTWCSIMCTASDTSSHLRVVMNLATAERISPSRNSNLWWHISEESEGIP
jgi:hypothetical protein